MIVRVSGMVKLEPTAPTVAHPPDGMTEGNTKWHQLYHCVRSLPSRSCKPCYQICSTLSPERCMCQCFSNTVGKVYKKRDIGTCIVFALERCAFVNIWRIRRVVCRVWQGTCTQTSAPDLDAYGACIYLDSPAWL